MVGQNECVEAVILLSLSGLSLIVYLDKDCSYHKYIWGIWALTHTNKCLLHMPELDNFNSLEILEFLKDGIKTIWEKKWIWTIDWISSFGGKAKPFLDFGENSNLEKDSDFEITLTELQSRIY